MTVNEAVKYFGTGYKLCKKLGLTPSNYYKWKTQNWIPVKQQFLINQITGANMPIDLNKEAMEQRIGQKDI